MKRRHELVIGGEPLSPSTRGAADDSLDVKTTRQISKRRRVVGPDAWNKLVRKSTLQDINNLSHHPTTTSDKLLVSEHVDDRLPETKMPSCCIQASVPSRPVVPRPISEPRPPSLDVSVPEDYGKGDIHSHPPPGPSSRQTPSGPVPSSQYSTSQSIRFNSPHSQLIPQGKPVRIKQLQEAEHAKVARRNQESDLGLDSDLEDEDELTVSEDEDDPTEETPEDSAEREVVESRYADINK
ncbi:hypothetical protein RhiJN_04130 [Ceratobasidium sp. AG-Ba]|nr:hypothetical protein RhiJN_04130 [Ceratobasidium sp. AG-Ba]QRW05023.1 hypothetical protein RhiLY_04022 [Ceratobasidium sp. AG-Ba]